MRFPLPLLTTLAVMSCVILPCLAEECVEVPVNLVGRINPMAHLTTLTTGDRRYGYNSADKVNGWVVTPVVQGVSGVHQSDDLVGNKFQVLNRGADLNADWAVFRTVDSSMKAGPWQWLQKGHGCSYNKLDYNKLFTVQYAPSPVHP